METKLRTAYPMMAQSIIPQQPEPVIDEASATVTYYGYADLGTGDTEEKWLIARKTKTGNVTRTEYPNGSMEPNQAWSSRTTLSYAR